MQRGRNRTYSVQKGTPPEEARGKCAKDQIGSVSNISRPRPLHWVQAACENRALFDPGEQLLGLPECYGERHVQPGDRPTKALSPQEQPGGCLPFCSLPPLPPPWLWRSGVQSWEAHLRTRKQAPRAELMACVLAGGALEDSPVDGPILSSKVLYCIHEEAFPRPHFYQMGFKGHVHMSSQGCDPSSFVEMPPQSGNSHQVRARFSLVFPFPRLRKSPCGLKNTIPSLRRGGKAAASVLHRNSGTLVSQSLRIPIPYPQSVNEAPSRRKTWK